jgi:flavodoxin I|tara:strand:- start:1172 stop:1678 length:507 start_codon:yes stop_codon:yes gene_type:complete
MKIGIIWGSDSGDTEDTTMTMEGKLTSYDLEVINVAEASVEDFRKFDLLILGISTWYDGDLQSDWEDFFPTFEKIDFTDKTVAIFGLGDQYGYDEYFIDGVGILAKEILKNGGEVIGHWSTESYEFVKSKALMNENTFYGLALDEGNQYDLSPERIDKWLLSLGLEIS